MSGWLTAYKSPALAGFFMAAALWLGGCATLPVAQLQTHWPAGLPERIELSDTPFFAQAEYECGPAALAMVMGAAGHVTTPDALVPQVYLPSRKGSLQIEMPVATRRAGLLAYTLAPTLAAVLQEVAAGHPVLVFQNLALPWYPVWHYAVVMGYDRAAGELLLHSGTTKRMPISLDAFENTWARGDHWAMVALAPQQLPATASPAPLADAIVALERVKPAAAAQAYAAALQRWPDNRSFLLGRGNAAYATGQWQDALTAYAAATRLQPDFADAWNNLAQVLWEQELNAEALVTIRKAVTLGGPRLPDYQTLERSIQSDLKR